MADCFIKSLQRTQLPEQTVPRASCDRTRLTIPKMNMFSISFFLSGNLERSTNHRADNLRLINSHFISVSSFLVRIVICWDYDRLKTQDRPVPFGFYSNCSGKQLQIKYLFHRFDPIHSCDRGFCKLEIAASASLDRRPAIKNLFFISQ